ncbi:type VI lipase adapter Tla3 domain-containing protein [Burkholderia gladioli]|uniref:type VI lipase adapter Tla3 domain-containing protein n=1 Tax=Burkholderia gladioli TaxID=28095 RepID=UPI00163F2CB2|nr:DUF2875 family protein [Burkholderia gladioli]
MVWIFGGRGSAKAEPTSSIQAQQTSAQTVPGGSATLAKLEVRGLGITVDRLSQTEIWDHVVAKNATHESIFSRRSTDYSSSWADKSSMAKLRRGLALKYGASRAVEYTPLPMFVYGPPRHPDNAMDAAFAINGARQDGSLPFDLFMSVDAVNGAEVSLSAVFKFFDDNPDAPFAIVLCSDGMVARKLLEKPGSGLLPDGAVVPTVFDSTVALLVARPGAVDRLRATIVTEPRSVDTREDQYDLVKLWNFYWDETDRFDEHFIEEQARHGGSSGVAPHTMSAAWWRSRVPELLAETANKGPSIFTPGVWTPVRWTDWQLQQFDASPILGYIERPVGVRLTDEHSAPLREKDQAAALHEAWSRLVAANAPETKPARVFFDTTGAREWVIPLTQALGADAAAPSTGDVKEGFDVGYRLGNTGVCSTAIQIGLALMAGYHDGKASAVVGRSGDWAEIAAITPPGADERKQSSAARGDNPFIDHD